ncbi:hypothetical protein V8D89_003867 [Ganoderma adspersum]
MVQYGNWGFEGGGNIGSCSTSESSDDIITLVWLWLIMNALCTHVHVSHTHNPLGLHRLALLALAVLAMYPF